MKILVGMSGGLDSTYAALKLIDEGHTVEGAVLIMHDYTDLAAARESASAIGIKLHEIDCRVEFSAVKGNFAEEYKRGRTPNPCIVCNPLVKFRCLADFALKNGFDKIATGHYARVEKVNGRYALARAKDERKDQTYMLYRLPQDILSMLCLPLADAVKTDVRAKAEAIGLAVAGKKESQEICFIPDGDYASYIEGILGVFPEGNFIDENGKILGRHKGIIRYTIGQRKGLGISAGERIFVSEIDPENNTVVLSRRGSFSERVLLSDMVFGAMALPEEREERRVKVKLRYLAPLTDTTAVFYPDSTAELILDTPAKAVTPGQSAVIYDGDVLLAGGFIN